MTMTPRFFLLGVFAIGSAGAMAATACSSDDKVSVGGDPDGGTNEAGAGSETGSGPDAGGPQDSGFVQEDSAKPDAGKCSNEAIFKAGFQASCSTCLSNNCCAEVKNCEAIPDCQSFAQCYAGCKLDGGTQSACQSTCIAGKDGGAIQAPYFALLSCGDKTCHNDGGAGVPLCPF